MMAKSLLLLHIAVLIIESVNTNFSGYYAIPDPEIIAFEGGGLRVVVKDDVGISLFRFHGNVNKEMKQLYPGGINIEASSKINGKWILEDRSVKLYVGDMLSYWLFVEKDRLGYVKQPAHFKINELVPFYNDYSNVDATTTTTYRTLIPVLPTTVRPNTRITEAAPTAPSNCPSPLPNIITLTSLQNQIDTLNKKLDLMTSISALQEQVDTFSKKLEGIATSAVLPYEVRNISKTVELIMQTLEALPETKRLTLSGFIPPDPESNPDRIVRLVIWEKLDLQVNIIAAIRNKDGTIRFELNTLQEKFDVLSAAKEKLKGSRIVIS